MSVWGVLVVAEQPACWAMEV